MTLSTSKFPLDRLMEIYTPLPTEEKVFAIGHKMARDLERTAIGVGPEHPLYAVELYVLKCVPPDSFLYLNKKDAQKLLEAEQYMEWRLTYLFEENNPRSLHDTYAISRLLEQMDKSTYVFVDLNKEREE